MKLRVAIHCENINKVSDFYKQILGLSEIGRFEAHNGYDGIMLSKDDSDWHLELTQNGIIHESVRDLENVIVFYPDNEEEFISIEEQITSNEVPTFVHPNPYWKDNGIGILDPEGNRIIVNNTNF